MKAQPFAWLVLAVTTSGCQTGNSGNLFDVTTTMGSSSCGTAVEVDDTETFQVRLTKDDYALKSADRGPRIWWTL